MEIETKYSLGDKVWAMIENHPTYFQIKRIGVVKEKHGEKVITVTTYRGSTMLEPVMEQDCFNTKDELLNSFK